MAIALDSNILIAALAPDEPGSKIAQQLIRDIAAGKQSAIASSLTYSEVLGNSTEDLSNFFSRIKYLKTTPANDEICITAGELRLKYGSALKTPDALHLATALAAKAEVFITNDKVLAKIASKVVPTKELANWR